MKLKNILILSFVIISILYGQSTGYVDNFDGGVKFSGPSAYTFLINEGILDIQIDKESNKKWQWIKYQPGESLDISAQPIINIRMQSDIPFLLTFNIADNNGNKITREKKIYASESFVDYYFDFSGDYDCDRSQIFEFNLVPNGNTFDPLNGRMAVDYLKAGDEAQKIAAIGAVNKQLSFINSNGNTFQIFNIENTSEIVTSDSGSLIENLDINYNNKRAKIDYDAGGTIGIDTISIIAMADSGYANNNLEIPIEIEGNYPPTMDTISDVSAVAGDTTTVQLSGISDGNSTVEQALSITATSNNQAVLPDSNISIIHEANASTALVQFVTIQEDRDIRIELELNDNYSENNIYQTEFYIDSYADINHPPEIDFIPNQSIDFDGSSRSINLTGISDGDQGDQHLNFIIASSNQQVLPDTNIAIEYDQGETEAELTYTPDTTGTTTITIQAEDDGGNENNNGDQMTEIEFQVEVIMPPPTGHSARMVDMQNWGVDTKGGEQEADIGDYKGRENVLRIKLNNKACWTGTMYDTPELDLNKYRYVAYDIYFEGESFHHDPPAVGHGMTHCYLYDKQENPDHNLNRNVDAAHNQREKVDEQEWTTVFMDFRGNNGIKNSKGQELNIHRIQQVLLNYASEFTWPFPHDNGTVYIDNLNIGSAVPDRLVPEREPKCTIAPVPDMVFYKNSEPETITLSNITSGGSQGVPEITAISSDTAIVPHPQVSQLEAGSVNLTLWPQTDMTGEVTITLTISAAGSRNKTRRFKVEVIEQDSEVDIIVLRDTLFQEIKGFGTFEFEDRKHFMELYTDNLGASAVRTGLISNQIEPVNDNTDPDVLALENYNKGAFDFDYYRELKNRGVETFILTSWSPPGWMKRNMSVAYGYAAAIKYEHTDNILEPYYYGEFAESMVAAVKMFRNQAGIELDAIGPQNEPAFCEPYASAILSPDKFAELIEVIGDRFQREGLSTKIYMPEQVFTQPLYSMSEYINILSNYQKAEQYTDIIATHGYGESGVEAENPNYESWNELWYETNANSVKELWMTETNPTYEKWSDAFSLAGAIHGALAHGNVSLWTLWDIEGTLIKDNEPTASFYTSKNYYKYIRPGARRIKAIEKHKEILASAFIHPETKDQVIVVINKASSPISATLLGERHAENYDIYTTAKHMDFKYRGRAGQGGNIALPAQSVTTLVGRIDEPIVVGLEDEKMPEEFQLYQNYPNPFNPRTTIRFSLQKPQRVKLAIYNILGQRVRTLTNENYTQGFHKIIWNGKNDKGIGVASGVYIYRLKAGNRITTKKCVLLR